MRNHQLQKLLCAELGRQLEEKGIATVDIPAGGELLWGWFLDLSRTRTYHASGPNTIGYGEIDAYARSTRWPLEPHHVAIIRAMDDIWLKHARRRAAPAPDGVKAMVPVSATPLTAGMVDAIFG